MNSFQISGHFENRKLLSKFAKISQIHKHFQIFKKKSNSWTFPKLMNSSNLQSFSTSWIFELNRKTKAGLFTLAVFFSKRAHKEPVYRAK